jgi:hypothetical protein
MRRGVMELLSESRGCLTQRNSAGRARPVTNPISNRKHPRCSRNSFLGGTWAGGDVLLVGVQIVFTVLRSVSVSQLEPRRCERSK